MRCLGLALGHVTRSLLIAAFMCASVLVLAQLAYGTGTSSGEFDKARRDLAHSKRANGAKHPKEPLNNPSNMAHCCY